MRAINRILLFISCLIFLMSLTLAPLDDAVAKGKRRATDKSLGPFSRPYGWGKGKKEGWKSNEPPGLEGMWNGGEVKKKPGLVEKGGLKKEEGGKFKGKEWKYKGK
ncbi:MAG TPA: hypothetical protein ACFYD3_01970 [Candidatus Hypogeohydataceae bacterium YC41]